MSRDTALARSDRPPICAVVVTYAPDAGFRHRLMAIAAESDHVLVVDNGSPAPAAAGLPTGIEWLQQTRNVGMAAALNIGLARARALGFDWAVTFDQDSTPAAGMLTALWATRVRRPEPGRVAVVGPRVHEERFPDEEILYVVRHPRCRLLFRRPAFTEERDLAGVAFVISSGALLDLTILERIGPMDAGLFMDYIDHDYCLRAGRHGYEIVVSAAATLSHNLGRKREYRLGRVAIRPTFHSPLRLRYMYRNRLRLWWRYALHVPHWAAFDAVFTVYSLARLLLFENQRGVKVWAALLGIRDGVLCRSGPIEAGHQPESTA